MLELEKIYSIRKAKNSDIDFLSDVIIGAEKSMTNNLGLSTLFEIPEKDVKKFIIKMLEEEIDGCEFSVSSFFVVVYKSKPVAALGGWLEGFYEDLPSSLLKSNLIGATFPSKNLKKVRTNLEIIKDVQIEREKNTYQLEYSFVDKDHRGKKLTQHLMKAHLDFANEINPDVKKAQLHVFENNEIIIKIHQRSGFKIAKRYVSDNKDILRFLPYNVKLLMEKNIIKNL